MCNGEKRSAGFKGYSARNGHTGPGSAADPLWGNLLLQSRSGRREPSALSTGTRWSSTALGPGSARQSARAEASRFVACNFTDLDHNLPVTFTLFVELTGAAELALPKNHYMV